jgi:DNA-binding transcriptional ArsR family regulator
MDELIVRLMRTLANQERLRILSFLFTQGEKPPSEIAHKLGLLDSVLSSHLAKLAAVGIVQRRRSGGWIYCAAVSPYAETTLSGKTTEWLKRLLTSAVATVKDYGLREVRNSPDGDAEGVLRQVIFDAATAFTDVRRIQIVRHLFLKGASSMETLCDDLKMSIPAACRQTDKLVRRGYVLTQSRGLDATFSIAKEFKTRVHAELWEIVRESWKEKELRTSRSP